MLTCVDFEIAKVLKEEGFDKFTLNYYFEDGEFKENSFKGTYGYYGDKYTIEYDEFLENWNSKWVVKKNGEKCFGCHKSKGYFETYSAPIIAEVVMWLYEKHRIWISVSHQRHSQGKHWKYHIKQASGVEIVLWEHNSPTEAYTEAIKHCLIKLKKKKS